MTPREKVLGILLLVTAAAAGWSVRGFPLGAKAPPALRDPRPSAHPCPPGFEPRYRMRRLPDVPPGSVRPALPEPEEACVAWAEPPAEGGS